MPVAKTTSIRSEFSLPLFFVALSGSVYFETIFSFIGKKYSTFAIELPVLQMGESARFIRTQRVIQTDSYR